MMGNGALTSKATQTKGVYVVISNRKKLYHARSNYRKMPRGAFCKNSCEDLADAVEESLSSGK